MKKGKATGAALATAAALMFGGLAAGTASAEEAKVQCAGVNACKGHSDCKTAKHECKGHNACKGQGFVMMTKAECEAAKTKQQPS